MNDRQSVALVRAMPVIFVLIWSTGFIVARYGMPHSPPLKFLSVRYILSVACFLVWALAARAAWPSGRRQWFHLAVTGVLMHAGYLGGVWAAVKLGMGAGLVALLVGLQPVLTAIWVSQRGGEVSSKQWGGLALGFAGLALVVWEKLGMGEVQLVTLMLSVLALLSITAGTLYQKRFVAPCDVRTANMVQLAAAFVVSAPLALLEPETMHWTGQLTGAMVWSVLVLTLGGSSLLYMLIQRGAATAVTSLLYLVPPCTALLAWLLFGEPITALIIVGTALTAFGVSLVVRAAR
ncbi:DMT family transporter [Variovorax sp. VNK109]|jgi:drug/metabolite transporter (DMT)-like permease|uniref:DMT family transporter n=1 Tax=Variovorax sp. VNK109 TaxID=3400919 RepID=UPI003C08FA99